MQASKQTVTKKTAIWRLVAAGHGKVAAELEGYRSRKRNDWGWDLWFKAEFPNLVPVVWP